MNQDWHIECDQVLCSTAWTTVNWTEHQTIYGGRYSDSSINRYHKEEADATTVWDETEKQLHDTTTATVAIHKRTHTDKCATITEETATAAVHNIL